MAVVQLSAAITEFFQLLLDGPVSYFEVKWNWIKCFGIIFFWMGFWDIWARVKNAEICASSAEACAQASAENAQISAVLTRAHMSQKPIQKKMMPKHLIQFHLTSK